MSPTFWLDLALLGFIIGLIGMLLRVAWEIVTMKDGE